uniref:BHLH domain-containing protein n=1 Tax=Musa acuminata subsp. malaccensis TaxID=214687 RepID=A0A804KJJ4_MUSAM|nr:PREDICTED: transcription factor bHLH30-like isoform X2 [Musa acuminata subsp. malaccensis]XP_018686893.1 PREDICTED: transcription factor bHLH30-like isoform X2 [Musa acuminata subsp. malaccensis]
MQPVATGEMVHETRTAGETRAVRSHSEAERRRRQRINGHLATLRSLLPAATRLDKAALLGEVVRQVRELRVRVEEVAVMVPGEGDEVGVEEEEEEGGGGGGRGRVVRAWVCCADRPGLMGELSRAVRSVRARAVRAEMVTVGGRTRSLLELEVSEAAERGEGRSALQAALWAVLLTNRTAPAENYSKRARTSTRFSKT